MRLERGHRRSGGWLLGGPSTRSMLDKGYKDIISGILTAQVTLNKRYWKLNSIIALISGS